MLLQTEFVKNEDRKLVGHAKLGTKALLRLP